MFRNIMIEERTRMLTIANTMAPHAGLAGVLLAADQHSCCRLAGTADRKTGRLVNQKTRKYSPSR